MNGFTDIHHHLLWGMDDGPRSAEEMRAMLCRAGEEKKKQGKKPAVEPKARPGGAVSV